MSGHHSTVPSYELLKSYIETRKLPSVRHRFTTPSQTDLTELFSMCLGLAALQVLQLTPGISEASIDVLAVSGVIGYPPSEGGPLNQLARYGQTAVKETWTRLAKFVPSETKEAFEKLLDKEPFNTLFVSAELKSKLSPYQEMREETLLLTSSELSAIGRTGMVGKSYVFMYPLPTILATGLILFIALSALCVFLYYVFR